MAETETGQAAVYLKKILPPFLWAAVILFLSFMCKSIQDALPIVSVNVVRQLLHLTGYAFLGALTARALHLDGNGLSPRASFWTAVILCMFFAVIGEALCGISLEKTSADDACWRADAIGATAGIWLWAMNMTRQKKFAGLPTSPKSDSPISSSDAEKAGEASPASSQTPGASSDDGDSKSTKNAEA